MRIPEEIRDRVRTLLWERAANMGWSGLADTEKARHYEFWSRDAEVGETLAHYMDARKVRVYIKDSLLKPYERSRVSKNESDILEILQIPQDLEVSERQIKPHGLLFVDGRAIAWGNSRDWKSILMALFERCAQDTQRIAFGVVLLETGKTVNSDSRDLVSNAANRLGIEKLCWIG